MLDLTDASVRKQLGVRKADLVKSRDYSKTQAIGDWEKANGYDGILAPSARNGTGSIGARGPPSGEAVGESRCADDQEAPT